MSSERISVPNITPLDPRFELLQTVEELPGLAMQSFVRRAKAPEGTTIDPGFKEIHRYDYPGGHRGFMALRVQKNFTPTRDEALQQSLIHVVDLTGKGTQIIGEGIVERSREDFSTPMGEPVVTLNEDAEGKERKGYNIRRLALLGAAAIKLWDGALATSGDISQDQSNIEAWEALAEKGIVEPYEIEVAEGLTQVQYRFINQFKQK